MLCLLDIRIERPSDEAHLGCTHQTESRPQFLDSVACSRHIDRGVSVLSTLGIWVCARRSIAPRRARVQRRGRPISEKALVILECNEAFENTELSPWNAKAKLPGLREDPSCEDSRHRGPGRLKCVSSPDGPLAQWLAQPPYTRLVGGSNPSRPTHSNFGRTP